MSTKAPRSVGVAIGAADLAPCVGGPMWIGSPARSRQVPMDARLCATGLAWCDWQSEGAAYLRRSARGWSERAIAWRANAEAYEADPPSRARGAALAEVRSGTEWAHRVSGVLSQRANVEQGRARRMGATMADRHEPRP